MSFKFITFLGCSIPLPLRFGSRLMFSEADKRDMPWLVGERYYGIESELGKGGRAVAYKGFVADKDGNRLIDTPDIVLKIPNLNTDLYTSDQVKEFLRRQSEECGREWQLTRGRLHHCEFANPILDFSVVEDVTYLSELMPMPVTAQLLLHDKVSLDEYLLNTKQRLAPYKSKRGIPVDNWKGMNNPDHWLKLAQCIALGLADIHQRRVVHGDIWPPNIFIKNEADEKPAVVFIDFGESFPIEPKGDPQKQRDHAYRAPERKDAQSIVTWQADVYSFGKLLLHLAIGEEPILSAKYRGHERREIVKSRFAQRNPEIANDNPFIVDIICKCLSLDPIDRPTMTEVSRALNTYVDIGNPSRSLPNISDGLKRLDQTWQEVKAESESRGSGISPFLEEIVEQRLNEVQWMIRGLSNEVVSLGDTRERLILALLGLFQRLGTGDSFLSITTPRMWQGSALGLDGRYFTATALAASRGASIQRSFIFSVQEVGYEWAEQLASNLKSLDKKSNPAAVTLAQSLDKEIKRYLAACQQGEAHDLPENLQVDARSRIKLIIKSYLDVSGGVCKNAFDQAERFQSSAACKGMYLGLIPVSTLGEMRTLKASYPVSVFYYSNAEERDRFLLMMTECLGRHSLGGSEENTYDDVAFQGASPELRGISVFKSVLGVPEDRIKKLEQIFRLSTSIGYWLDTLYDILPDS